MVPCTGAQSKSPVSKASRPRSEATPTSQSPVLQIKRSARLLGLPVGIQQVEPHRHTAIQQRLTQHILLAAPLLDLSDPPAEGDTLQADRYQRRRTVACSHKPTRRVVLAHNQRPSVELDGQRQADHHASAVVG